MSALVICDIDGVLADCTHRLPYLADKNYEAFYSCATMIEDKLIGNGKYLLNKLAPGDECYYTYLLTGRPERTRLVTEMWLEYHGIKFGNLIMRKDGDYRPSSVVKTEQMQEILDEEPYRRNWTKFFIDDDPENVKAVCKRFPAITGITFGTKRMEKK